MSAADNLEKATFAGGCFWCTQADFDQLPGVVHTQVGYTGGSIPNPTYEEVCSEETGHAEALEIMFDPTQISYQQLVEAFWKSINPTQVNGQFYDEGEQYRTVIYYHSEAQRQIAQNSKEALEASGRFSDPIATEIQPAEPFYPAEEAHQKYYCKNPFRYHSYHNSSGREDYKREYWDEARY